MNESGVCVVGRVVRVDGPVLQVEIDGGELACVLRGRLRKMVSRVSSPVVVGDVVEVDVDPAEGGRGAIAAVRPRACVLERPGVRHDTRVVAANMDHVIVVVSAAEPAFKPAVVDRFLVHVHRGRARAVVVLSKMDLVAPEVAAGWIEDLAASGTETVPLSVRTGQGLERTREICAGRLSVLVGQSGVGKSSLLNALLPDADLRTAALTTAGKGRHTTTATQAYRLPGGGLLVDTPGVKTLGMWETSEEDAGAAFPDIEELAESCRFRDCRHDREPQCAVKGAVEEGRLSEMRYESFRRIAGRQ